MAEITARKSLSGRNVFTMEIKIEKTKTPKAKPVDETKLGFGHIFTDHMFVMEYDTGKGWHDARIFLFHLPLWFFTTDRKSSRV